ncbi:hypothetical protein Tco_0107945 [Tanacetum coccineum]
MSPVVVETPNADGSVCNTANREEAIPRDFPTSLATPSAMRDFCERHYAKILPFMAEKAHSQKLKNVRSRLTFSEDTEQETESASRYRKRKRRGGKQKMQKYERVNSSDELLESKDNARGRHWKRQPRRAQNHDGEDLSDPYDEESTTPFTQRIKKFVFPMRIRMPSMVKTYDGIGDSEDHLKTFTIAA